VDGGWGLKMLARIELKSTIAKYGIEIELILGPTTLTKETTGCALNRWKLLTRKVCLRKRATKKPVS